MGGMVETLHSSAQVQRIAYTPEGIEVEATVEEILYGRLRDHVVKE